jgi:hypothetical protein
MMKIDDFDDYFDYEDALYSGIHFANAGSALRAASTSNPRNCDCPTCGAPNLLTPADVQLGYQCDKCADRAEQ